VAEPGDAGGPAAVGAGIGDGDLEVFFGKNARYYLTETSVMAASGSKVSWNWPAFLFGPFWMFYRKMWARGTLVALLCMVFNASVVFSWMSGVVLLLAGMYGNVLYLDHARRRVAEIDLARGGPETRLERLARAGGTSWPAAILVAVLFVLATVVMVFIWTGVVAAFLAALMWW